MSSDGCDGIVFGDEIRTPNRYRDIACYLWQLVIQHITCDNAVNEVLNLFKRSRDMTCEALIFERDLEYSSIFNSVVEQFPNVEARLEDRRRIAAMESRPPEILQPANYREIQLLDCTSSITDSVRAAPRIDTELTCRAPGDHYAETRKQVIEATRQDPGTGGLDTVAGLSVAKQLIKEAVVMPIKYPQLFTGSRRPWARILMYGPPGTGKTRLANAVAVEVKCPFYSISSADLLSSWIGESEKLIRDLFQYVNERKEKAVIFFDEIDGLCRKRSSGEQDHTRRMKTELLNQLEKMKPDVFLLAATNCPWDIDKAFMRRFQCRVYIPLPDRDARLAIFNTHIEGSKVALSEIDWQALLDKTEGYSGSDLASLTNYALMEPVRDIPKSTHWTLLEDGTWMIVPSNHPEAFKCSVEDLPPWQIGVRDVYLSDFIKAVKETSKTISQQDLEEYDKFEEKFG